jgi:ribosomal protein S18 acetylase RimI-like enzyme
MNAMAPPCDSFPVRLDVVIRPCREADLPALEWFGLFAPHRQMIRRVFEQQRRGEALMLVVEANGEPSGQLWIDLRRGDEDGQVGEIWAVRVLPCLQRRGIGTRLVAVAEALLRERGFARAQLRVETDNPAARRLYERLGYALAGTAAASSGPGAVPDDAGIQWVLAKTLLPAASTSVERAR